MRQVLVPPVQEPLTSSVPTVVLVLVDGSPVVRFVAGAVLVEAVGAQNGISGSSA
jgi:hypothetical protein